MGKWLEGQMKDFRDNNLKRNFQHNRQDPYDVGHHRAQSDQTSPEHGKEQVDENGTIGGSLDISARNKMWARNEAFRHHQKQPYTSVEGWESGWGHNE
jgi:hypothetical protein